MEHPQAELSQLVELDDVAVMVAVVVEAGELGTEPLEQPVSAGVHGRGTVAHEAMERTLVAVDQGGADGVEDCRPLVEHRQRDGPGEDPVELVGRHRGQERAVEDGHTIGEGTVDAGGHRLGVAPAVALVVGLETLTGVEVGESEVQRRHQQRDVDEPVGIVAEVELHPQAAGSARTARTPSTPPPSPTLPYRY